VVYHVKRAELASHAHMPGPALPPHFQIHLRNPKEYKLKAFWQRIVNTIAKHLKMDINTGVESLELPEDAQRTLYSCATWLSSAAFKTIGDYEICEDKVGLIEHTREFLDIFGLLIKVI
jgi:hypothetical protein